MLFYVKLYPLSWYIIKHFIKHVLKHILWDIFLNIFFLGFFKLILKNPITGDYRRLGVFWFWPVFDLKKLTN